MNQTKTNDHIVADLNDEKYMPSLNKLASLAVYYLHKLAIPVFRGAERQKTEIENSDGFRWTHIKIEDVMTDKTGTTPDDFLDFDESKETVVESWIIQISRHNDCWRARVDRTFDLPGGAVGSVGVCQCFETARDVENAIAGMIRGVAGTDPRKS